MVEIAQLEATKPTLAEAEGAAHAAAPRGGTARIQSHARPSRLPSRASPIPEITEMQARAIFEAAVEVAKKGVKVHAGNHDSADRHH